MPPPSPTSLSASPKIFGYPDVIEVEYEILTLISLQCLPGEEPDVVDEAFDKFSIHVRLPGFCSLALFDQHRRRELNLEFVFLVNTLSILGLC